MKQLFTFLLLILAIQGMAQRVSIGVKAGYGSSKIRYSATQYGYSVYGKSTVFNNPVPAFEAGALCEIKIIKPLFVQTELLYSIVGENVKTIDKSFGEHQARNNFNYLTLPVLVKLKFGKTVRPYINTGISFNYLVKQSTPDRATEKPSHNLIDNYNKLNESFIAAVGVEASKSKIGPFIELRYSTGINNILTPSYSDLYHATISYFTINGGIKF